MSGKKTGGQYPQEWKSRREIPNPQVKDTADQYEQARLILIKQPPGTGVVLPIMYVAGIAIELYLKCLAAEVIHVPEDDGIRTGNPKIDDVKFYRVHALAKTGGHNLGEILCEIEGNIRGQLESSYKAETKRNLQDDISKISDVLVRSRYTYEFKNDPSDIDFPTLMSLSAFLKRFVDGLEPKNVFRW